MEWKVKFAVEMISAITPGIISNLCHFQKSHIFLQITSSQSVSCRLCWESDHMASPNENVQFNCCWRKGKPSATSPICLMLNPFLAFTVFLYQGHWWRCFMDSNERNPSTLSRMWPDPGKLDKLAHKTPIFQPLCSITGHLDPALKHFVIAVKVKALL